MKLVTTLPLAVSRLIGFKPQDRAIFLRMMGLGLVHLVRGEKVMIVTGPSEKALTSWEPPMRMSLMKSLVYVKQTAEAHGWTVLAVGEGDDESE